MKFGLGIYKEIQIFDFGIYESKIQKAEQELDLEEMQRIADLSANTIALKVEECTKNINEAKNHAENAEKMDIGFWDKITFSGDKKELVL